MSLNCRPQRRSGLEQRFIVSAWNRVARSRGRGETAARPLSAEGLLEEAVRRTGLTDFGDDLFMEPFERVVASINESAKLQPFGSFLASRILDALLCNRLYIERDWGDMQDDTAGEIQRPVFITGLPRTGTTFLFGLLARDPQHRVLTNWESSRPAPPPGWWRRKRVVRLMQSVIGLAVQDHLAPSLRRIHRSMPAGPEECTGLLMNTFACQAFAALFNVPEYLDWLEEYDFAPVTSYHRRQLTLIHNQRPGRQWLLKSPNHLPALGQLLRTYPNAYVVQTHRDPLEVLPSCCSLIAAFRGIFSDTVSEREIGRQTMRALANNLRRAAASRDRLAAERFFDVRYQDLVRNPLKVVREIYARFELDLTPETEQLVRAAAISSRNLHPTHNYSLAQFDIDAEEVRSEFGWYTERFDGTSG